MVSVSVNVTVRILPVHEADTAAAADLVNRAFDRYGAFVAGPRTSHEGYLDEASARSRILAVEEHGTLIATAMISPADDHIEQGDDGFGEQHPWQGALYFGLAGVSPEQMGGGLGRMLVAKAESIAREEGFSAVALGTVREYGLVEYYERQGYRVIREREYPAGHWEFLAPHHYCEMVKPV
ncbi:MAG TPA: GNAT family N-acetyltransferase [Tepidiformaceae bacterium]|nr:GNAT family N-acetyltransferase [Tepidiformaceae bacterium]